MQEEDELILVDDGSMDATPEIAARYLECHAGRLRYTPQENCGPAAARHLGMEQARAQRVLFLDADDALEPSALATFNKFFQSAEREVCWVLAGYTTVLPDGTSRENLPSLPKSHRARFRAWLRGSFRLQAGNIAIDRLRCLFRSLRAAGRRREAVAAWWCALRVAPLVALAPKILRRLLIPPRKRGKFWETTDSPAT